MGLLDNLIAGHNANFGGQNGGLLDFLRNTQMQQDQYQPSGGFSPMAPPPQPETAAQPIQVGGLQMPRIGAAAQFDPQQVNLPQNAQPAQGQMPMQTPQQSPGGFGAGLQGFLQNLHTGPIGALAGGIGSAMGMQDPSRQNQNQTAQFLVSKGIDPALAKSIVSDPATLRSVLPSLIGTGGMTDDLKEYEYARKQEPGLTFKDFMNRKRSVTGEYGLNVIYGTNDKGETVAFQPSKSGGLVEAKLPPGAKLSSGTDKVDAGTHWNIYDKRTGSLIGTMPKDIEGKESAEERGKARGLAEVALPNAIASAEQTLKIIKDIKDDPYRAQGTGASSIFNSIPATGGYDFAQKLEQLKGKSFLEAFTNLKGGGAITEIEGKKAENAIARLSPGQSEGAFSKALDDLEEVVTAGIERAKVRAGKGGQPAAAPQASSDGGWTDLGGVKIRKKQ